jgi:hypothetical protein
VSSDLIDTLVVAVLKKIPCREREDVLLGQWCSADCDDVTRKMAGTGWGLEWMKENNQEYREKGRRKMKVRKREIRKEREQKDTQRLGEEW